MVPSPLKRLVRRTWRQRTTARRFAFPVRRSRRMPAGSHARVRVRRTERTQRRRTTDGVRPGFVSGISMPRAGVVRTTRTVAPVSRALV